MQINLLKKVVENTAGLQAVKIVDMLYNKKDINEFLIAKKLGLTINQTRNLLYRLSHLGILSSTRKKDKRKGWYIYFWTFNVLTSLEVLQSAVNSEILAFKKELESKLKKRFYKCKLCGREVSEESALLTDFICSECGEVYGLSDNKDIIEEMQKGIAKLEKELAAITEEVNKEQKKVDEKQARITRREENKKKKIRRIKMLQRRRLKERVLRKSKKKAKKRKIKKFKKSKKHRKKKK